MNDATRPDGSHDAPSSSFEHLGRVPDTSMLPGTRQPDNSILAPEDAQAALNAKTDQLRDMGEAWAEGVRSKVRRNPLASIAAALALGLVIARLKRRHHPPT